MRVPVYLGIDIGTQSVRVMAVSESGDIVANASHPLVSMRNGNRHEQSPESWWEAVAVASRKVMAVVGHAPVFGVAVDATSGTVLLVDSELQPLTAGLMYDDGRAQQEARAVNAAGVTLWSELSYRMQPSWALPKLLWLKNNGGLPQHGRVAHQSDFINGKLVGHVVAADSSNSLKTGYDLIRMRWPEAILEQLGLPPNIFPYVVPSGSTLGMVSHFAARETGIPAGTRLLAGMTDGCAAQLASGATDPGSWNSVIGTTLVIKGVTRTLLHDPLGVIYSHRSPEATWLPGGASSVGAGVLAQRFGDADLGALNAAAAKHGPSREVVYPLAGKGERYPFAAPDAMAFSLSPSASVEEQYTATLQGIAFVERLAFDGLYRLGAPMGGTFSISGGATRSEALNQMRADVLERELAIPQVTEGAFGMALLVAARDFSVSDAVRRMVRIERTIAPQRPFAQYAETYLGLTRELEARGWLPHDLATETQARATA